MAELEYLMDSVQPITAITRRNKSVFVKEFVDEDAYVRTYLSNHYRLSITLDRAEIITRLKGH